MIYGQEIPVEFPILDLYDTGAMLMYINAAKDQYDRNREDMNNFIKEYGDFISPILSHVDWVDRQTRGRVNDALNYLQQNGIDPLRSAEGRAIILNVINNTDRAGINMRRQSAKAADEYLKNRSRMILEGTYDPEFEKWRLGGKTLEDWDGNEQWTETSPFSYKDYSTKYGHIFKDLGLEYDKEASAKMPGFVVMSRNKDRMYEMLDKVRDDLRNDKQYQYDLENMKARVRAANPNATDEQINKLAEDAIANEIVDRNYKAEQKLEHDPVWQYQKDLALANVRHGGTGGRGSGSGSGYSQNDQWSFAEVVKRNAITSILGKLVLEYSPELLNNVRDNQIEFGMNVSKATKGHSYNGGIDMFKKKYGTNIYSENDIATYLRYPVTDERTKTMILPKQQIGRLYGVKSVVSHTTGFRGPGTGTNRKFLLDADVIQITPTQGSYGAFFKDDRYKNFFEFTVQTYKKEKVTDGDGKPVLDKNGNQLTRMKPDKKTTMYLDSHITSVRNAPGSGSLGIRMKDGSIKPVSNIKTVDTQDASFVDAMIGDKIATDNIVKGTIYGSDAILPELPEYAK